MTGEVTLTGQVLPIGGLKEKSLAAQRAGITRVIAPKLNEADLDEFPAHLIDDIEFVFVDAVDRGARRRARAAARRGRQRRQARAPPPPVAAALAAAGGRAEALAGVCGRRFRLSGSGVRNLRLGYVPA